MYSPESEIRICNTGYDSYYYINHQLPQLFLEVLRIRHILAFQILESKTSAKIIRISKNFYISQIKAVTGYGSGTKLTGSATLLFNLS